jgi:hypothetical protein
LTGKAVNWLELQAQLLSEQNGQTIPDYMKMLMLQSITLSPEIQEGPKRLEVLYDDPNYINDLWSKLKLPISIMRAEGVIGNEKNGWTSIIRSRLILRDFIKSLDSLDGLSMTSDELVELLGTDCPIHMKKMTKSDKIILLHKIRDADVMPERPEVNHNNILKLIKEGCESLLNDDNVLRPGSLRNTGKISENEEEIVISPNKIGGYKKVDETPIVIKKKPAGQSIEEKLLGNLEQNKGNINLHNPKEIKSESLGTPSSLKLDQISREFDPVLQEIKGKDPGFMKSGYISKKDEFNVPGAFPLISREFDPVLQEIKGKDPGFMKSGYISKKDEFNVPGAKGVLLWDNVTGLPTLTDSASMINFEDKNSLGTSVEDILAAPEDHSAALKNEPNLHVKGSRFTAFPAKNEEGSHESKILNMIFHKNNQPKVDQPFDINTIFQSKLDTFSSTSNEEIKSYKMDPEKDPIETLIDDFSGVLKKFVREHDKEIGELFGKIGSFFSNIKEDL